MTNSLLEENLLKASEGDKLAAEKVLTAFIDGPLFVPNRAQSYKLSHQPEYPNNLLSILGIQDKERVIVPVFTKEEYIAQWFGSELLFKSYSGKSLFSILPEDWWVCINPGQEIEKDISPWEISRLKEGAPGIKEILEEMSQEEAVVQSMETRQLADNEFHELKKKLIEFAEKKDSIAKMYMLLEKSLTIDGNTLEKILVGVECNENSGDLENLKDSINQICSINLIGNLDSRVLAGARGNNILLGVFKDTAPFYKGQKGIAGLIKGCLSKASHKVSDFFRVVI